MHEGYATDRLDKQPSAHNAVRVETRLTNLKARLTTLDTDRQHDRQCSKTLEQRPGDGLDKVHRELRDESPLLRADLTPFRGDLRGDCHALRTEPGGIRKHMHIHFLCLMGIRAATTFALPGLRSRAPHRH